MISENIVLSDIKFFCLKISHMNPVSVSLNPLDEVAEEMKIYTDASLSRRNWGWTEYTKRQ
jgi:hypothetical protein